MVFLRARQEEVTGNVELVRGTATGPGRWLASMLAVGGISIPLVLAAVWVGAAIVYTAQGTSGEAIAQLLAATAAQLPATLLYLGLIALVFAVTPRLTSAITWTILALGVFLAELGGRLGLPDWAIAISPFTHAPRHHRGSRLERRGLDDRRSRGEHHARRRRLPEEGPEPMTAPRADHNAQHTGPDSNAIPDDDARRYADELAALLDAAGFPRMPARSLTALLTSPTGELTAEQISDTLDVSPAAVSGALRYLQSVQVVRVGSLPGTRRRVYALAPNWYTITLTRKSMYSELSELSQQRPPSLGPGTAAGERIQEMADFYAFLSRKFPELLDEWNELRNRR